MAAPPHPPPAGFVIWWERVGGRYGKRKVSTARRLWLSPSVTRWPRPILVKGTLLAALQKLIGTAA
jgi:hypothetical protein